MFIRSILLKFLFIMNIGAVAAQDIPAIMGDWSGAYLAPEPRSYGALNPSIVGRVVGLPKGEFEVQLLNAFERRAAYDFRLRLKSDGTKISYSGKTWRFEISGDTWAGVRIAKKRNGEMVEMPFELKKVSRVSPTMGRAAPAGADILLPAEDLDQWHHGPDKPATWKLLDGAVLEIFPKKKGNRKGGDLQTKKGYKDCEIHIEFRLPYEPNNLGQARANSGIFIQRDYEVQILDSYGFDVGWSECGALYKVSPPKVNRTRPPGEWQTYDIIFRAARFDKNGKLVSVPEITVKHNGEYIHKKQALFELTQFIEINRLKPHPQEPLPIRLQDHSHPIQFRNFWVKPLEN